MTVVLTAPEPETSVEDVVFPPELEQALALVPKENLTERLTLPLGALDWQRDTEAACLTQCVESFYGDPNLGGADLGVRAICATCPLQTKCISHALVYEQWGVWALTERERAALGGVCSRSGRRSDYTPREAAASAIAAGVDPYALADALVAVHGKQHSAAEPDGVDDDDLEWDLRAAS